MVRNSNQGFSLVELIIVMAIMAVLVGVLAPNYMKYLDRARMTRDCTTVDAILDACEMLASDPDVSWLPGDDIMIEISMTGAEYSGGASTELSELVPGEKTELKSDDWGTIRICASKGADRRVEFDVFDDAQITLMARYSVATSERLK